MDIKADTRLKDLLDAYPYLVEFISEYRSEFAKLRNPVLRRTVGRVATLENVAEMGDVDPKALVADIAAEVARHDAGAPADERARRREVLVGIIRDLHAGRPVPELQARFSALAAEVDAATDRRARTVAHRRRCACRRGQAAVRPARRGIQGGARALGTPQQATRPPGGHHPPRERRGRSRDSRAARGCRAREGPRVPTPRTSWRPHSRTSGRSTGTTSARSTSSSRSWRAKGSPAPAASCGRYTTTCGPC